MRHKNIAIKSAVTVFVALGLLGLPAVTQAAIVQHQSNKTPSANHVAAWWQQYTPTGAFFTWGGRRYYMGDLNDPSLIVPGVSWQVNTERGLLLKGYYTVPSSILRWLVTVLGPIRAE
jgi:hypothetical protein